ncbi:MAG: glycosyltransferase [Planctomycetes bacterium]|nr:glycosyltransferase [Planctomycetota bacterium]
MLHFGMMCPEVSGHLNPMITLGNELHRRGHRITFIGHLDGKQQVTDAGLDFHAIATDAFPLGHWPQAMELLGKLSGWWALRFTLHNYRKLAGAIVRDAPDAIRDLQIDGLLIDQTYSAGGAVAEYVDLPFVTICNALMLNVEAGVPPIVTPWRYRRGWWARLRNQLTHIAFEIGTARMRRVVQRHQRKWKQRVHHANAQTFSPLAQIGQLPQEFDFPRKSLPAHFHYVGPMHESSCRKPVPFDFDRLDGRPLIYASLGTLQNRIGHVFEKIAAACAPLDAQLVISLGREDAELSAGLPGNPIVVPFAPQLELLKRASLVITHAGMNTAMESLAQGVPMVAIPITNDQPGVATRICWTGCGEMMTMWRLTANRLRKVVERVLDDESYRRNAERLRHAISSCGGVKLAADIAERAVNTGLPVLAGALSPAQRTIPLENARTQPSRPNRSDSDKRRSA